MTEPLLLIIVALASYRVTRLITTDTFPPIESVRNRIENKAPEWIADLITCSWCVGFWVSVVASVGFFHANWVGPVAAPFALSAIIGLLSRGD